MLADQNLNIHAELAGPPENFNHASRRGHAATRKPRHLHINDGAVEFRQAHAASGLAQAKLALQLWRQFIARRIDYLVRATRFAPRHRTSARPKSKTPYNGRVRTPDYAKDASLGTA